MIIFALIGLFNLFTFNDIKDIYDGFTFYYFASCFLYAARSFCPSVSSLLPSFAINGYFPR